MIDIEILKKEDMMLPIEYDIGSCEKTICDRLDSYINLLTDFKAGDDLIDRTGLFRDYIKEMFTEYYLGHQNKAYHAFKKAITNQIEGIDMVTVSLPKESLYRARKNEGEKDYKNDEMFHIKYNLRGKVRTQRFSFPGLPCLYLGSSTYVCWLELNRPQFDQFQVAAIRQKNGSKNFKLIDLCIHPLAYYNELAQRKTDVKFIQDSLNIETYLQWWPIMAACSIAVKNEKDPFKPEYIFPQFMLQYLLEEIEDEDCIGIQYFSIKAGKISRKQYETDYRTYTNYVIPAKTADSNGHGFCKFLEQEFGVVSNYSGRELQVLTDSIRESGTAWVIYDEEGKEEEKEKESPLDNALLFGTNDIDYFYSKSIFRRMEIILENRNMNQYTTDGKLILSPITEKDIYHLFPDDPFDS